MPPTQTEFSSTNSNSNSSNNSIESSSSSSFLSFDSSTHAQTPASAISPSSSTSTESSLGLDDEQEETKETIIVFDWDDTLLSSSWLACLGYRLDSDMNSAPAALFSALRTLASAVIDLLRLAAQNGRVVIITNAETGWVELSAQKFIPSVVPVLSELNIAVFSARSTFEPAFPDAPLKWKSCAFEHVLNETDSNNHNNSKIHKTVLSLGDSHVEREAVRQVTSEMNNTLCKSVKFAERPTCEQLTRQLTLVHNCFSSILNHQNHLDLQLTVTVNEQNQQQAKEEEEKMRCQEQSALAAHDDGCGGYSPSNNALCMDEDEEEKVLEAF